MTPWSEFLRKTKAYCMDLVTGALGLLLMGYLGLSLVGFFADVAIFIVWLACCFERHTHFSDACRNRHNPRSYP